MVWKLLMANYEITTLSYYCRDLCTVRHFNKIGVLLNFFP